ncbi:C40 family peptidase [Phytohabitans rumicis]|uniref:C40 family peptidase n=1 Tax=Phytohabitans rumicis TaxID=1076125 RepID=UPI001564D3EE|nr:NlpC/P60 family protein [Phytohabitans rumicis]
MTALALVPMVPGPPGDQLDGKLYAAAERLERVIEDYNEVRDDLRATRREQADLAVRMRPLEQALAARQARIGMMAATEYRNSGAGPVLAVITAESASALADRLLILDLLAAQQREAITALTAARARFDATRRTLDALAAQQTAQEQHLTGQRRQIEKDISDLERLREQTGYRPARGVRGFVPSFSAGRAGAAVRFAYAQLGKRYRFGAEGPDAYDCSGLTSAAWGRAGVALPHNARRQWHSVTRVSRSELRPGDLIFYYSSIHHVAMYVGGGKMIHAPQHGEPVRIDNVNYQPVHGYGRPS